MRRVRISELERLPTSEWDAALRESGRPYRYSHRGVAGLAFEAAFPSHRYEPLRVSFEDGTCLLVPLVMVKRRLPSSSWALGMPMSLEGTPVAVGGEASAEHLHALLGALAPYGALELNGGAGGSPPAAGRVEPGVTQILDLEAGYEAVWSGSFGAKTRNMCRKAQRSGLVVERESGPQAIHDYVELYLAGARRWGYAEVPHPRQLLEAVLSGEHAELWLGRMDGRAVAGAVMLSGSADLLYWSGAMDREFRHVAPGNAVIDAVIDAACRRGVSYLDFGASAGLGGVEAFKRSFGAQPVAYQVVTCSTRRYRHIERVQRRAARSRRAHSQR